MMLSVSQNALGGAELRAPLVVAMVGLSASLLFYALAIAKEQRGPASLGRALVMGTEAVLLVWIVTSWARTGRPPVTDLAGFLVSLSAVETAVCLLLDYWKGRRLLGLGAALACLLNIALAVIVLSPASNGAEEPVPVLHIVTFLVSFASFEILFISAFTSLMLQRLLKRKAGLWLFELTPSLEASARMSMGALFVGFAAWTCGLLSAYLYARGAGLPEGWRHDAKIYLTTFTWMAYLVTLVFGFRSAFRGRVFHIGSMVSFGFVLLTALASVIWSGFHRFIG